LSIQRCDGCPSGNKAYDTVLHKVEKFWKDGGFKKAGYDNCQILCVYKAIIVKPVTFAYTFLCPLHSYGDGGIAKCYFDNSKNGAKAGGAVSVRV
jgi:hypothetical protein